MVINEPECVCTHTHTHSSIIRTGRGSIYCTFGEHKRMFTTSPDTPPPAQPPIKQLELATAHSEQERTDHCRLLPPSKGQFLCGRIQPMGDPVQQGQSSRWARANGPGQGQGGGGGPRDWAPRGHTEAVCPTALLTHLPCSPEYRGWGWQLDLAGLPLTPGGPAGGACHSLHIQLFHEAEGHEDPQQEKRGPCPETLRWRRPCPSPQIVPK